VVEKSRLVRGGCDPILRLYLTLLLPPPQILLFRPPPSPLSRGRQSGVCVCACVRVCREAPNGLTRARCGRKAAGMEGDAMG